ncbi:uncharacterized protein [Physcomitrium patens]|uniref:Phytocyanin domain-containing protein n=1 Tax=Physcomitrium patens TaxID=3218 RepID=A0A2K1IEP4_PHYPA|nr:proline-rich receptor-like protein kinase PERK8 [Physcomitrium patens]XP_024365179.1 proline-rich receptor-like protein kinase PERK8 [Physcomitrium patens]PNR27751.1 hypothetical protein PHYPA_029903 [Physcomitrium patens]|eukprot:XP_024365178.1 proline-rich receptor-like protein kinase PERK8 [Physcomitrella patens]
MGLHRSILELVVVLACSALLLPVAMAVEYVVGGPGGWTSVPTASHYTDWATEKHFVTGDKLNFRYDPTEYNLQQVSSNDYSTCNTLHPIRQYQSGNDVVKLRTAGTYYYISGFAGDCNEGGMLMKVVVAQSLGPASAGESPPPLNHSPPPQNHPPPAASNSPPPANIPPPPHHSPPPPPPPPHSSPPPTPASSPPPPPPTDISPPSPPNQLTNPPPPPPPAPANKTSHAHPAKTAGAPSASTLLPPTPSTDTAPSPSESTPDAANPRRVGTAMVLAVSVLVTAALL